MRMRKEKQQDILLAAANLFLEKGYERTTIEDITNALGINKAMLYYYFANKQRVLYEIIASSTHNILVQSRAILRLKISPGEKMDRLIQNHLLRYTDKKAIPYVSHEELRNLSPKLLKRCVADRDRYEGIFRSVIREGIASGDFRNTDVNLAGAYILGMLNSVTGWYKSDGRLPMAEIKDRLADLLYNGIRIT